MHKIIFSKLSLEVVNKYTDNYALYYEDLYKDSGIWDEQKIIDGYRLESRERYKQILFTIKDKLENPIISYIDNEAIIKWRTKILIVNFKDTGDSRIITNISIR